MGEVDNGALAGGVVADGDFRQAALAEDGGDVDDAAVARLQHLAAEITGAAHDAENVGVDGVDPVLLGELVQGLALAAAGIVDQDIDLAVLGDDGLDGVGHVLGHAHVAADDQALRAHGADLFGDLVQLPLAAGEDGEVGALAGESEGELTAQAGGSAGDDCYSSVKIEHFFFLLFLVNI